jgi:hypothetical protein
MKPGDLGIWDQCNTVIRISLVQKSNAVLNDLRVGLFLWIGVHFLWLIF